MTQRQKGRVVVKRNPQLSVRAVYPGPTSEINLNTCGDVDCGNYSVASNFSLPVFKGSGGASQRKLLASTANSALSTGLGSYTLSGDDKDERISHVFEYQNGPRVWEDGRVMICQAIRLQYHIHNRPTRSAGRGW